jgi:large subunit ribosomal protein L7/L12
VIIMADDTKKTEKKEKPKELSKKVTSLVDEISKLSVMELSELVNALQDKLGVSAMPVAAPTAQAAAPTEKGAETEQTAAGAKQTVAITAVGENKIAIIKAIREINQNLGLKEAKDMTENLPAEILKEVKAEEAKEAADKLKAAGATVELK